MALLSRICAFGSEPLIRARGPMSPTDVEVKLSRKTPMEAQGVRSVAPTHDLGTRWSEWLASRPGRALPPGKGPPIPIVQEAGCDPEPVWTQRVEEKSSAGDRTSIARSSS
jgi:hypothetical protein